MTEIRFTPDGISSSYQVNVTSSNFAVISSDNVTPELQFVDLLENTSAFDRIVVIDENDRVFHSKNLILNNISASGFISASTLYVENSAFFQNGLTGSITGSNATFNQGIFNAITSSAISTSYIDLDPLVNGNAPPYREGRIYYSSEDGALTVYNNEEDISLQVGQEFYIRVRNETGVPIEDGTPIKISGSQGDTPLAHLAVAEDITQFYANPDDRELFQNHIIGLATHRIEHNTTGYATELGIVRGIDTTQFQAGDELYVSASAGELTNIPPEFPYEIIQVGTVVRSANNGFIFVNVKEPVNFGNISGYSGSYQAHLGDLWVYQPNGAWTHTRYVPQLTSSIISASNIYATNIFDINSESGSTGQILSSTPTGIDWIDISGISGSIIGSGTTNYLSKWKSSSELTSSVVYENSSGNIGIGTPSPTHVIEVSSSNQNLLNLNDVLYVSGSHLNGTGSGLVNIGTDKDLDVTVNIGKINTSLNVGSAILNVSSYYSPEIHLSAHNNWSNWTIEGGVNKDLKIYDQGTNRRPVVAIGTLTYPTTLVMTKTDPCFEVEIGGGNGRSLSIGQTFVGNTQKYDTHLRTSNGGTTYESFLFKHSGEIVASGSFIGSNVDVSGSTSNFHGDVKITGSLYLTGSLYDKNNTSGSTGQLLSSTTDGVDWIDATSIDGFISGSGTANYLSKWKSSSELTRSVIYEDVNGNIGIGTTSPSELFNIVGNSLLEGDLTVTGQSIFLSASYINLTSSNVNIGDNILTLNAFSPFKRYAGIEMNDSGSSAVAQFLWDSELDYFFISGSTATNSQNLVIVGPDSNKSLSTGYLTLATDINQLSSSVISQNNDGNIGIGTPNPTHSLDVVGGIKTDQLYDKNNTSGSDGQLLSSTTSGVDWIDATDIDGFISGSGTTNYIPIWKSSSELSSSNIYQLNGNVGIGTDSPTEQLEISENFRMPATTATTGIIYRDGDRFIHNFEHPTGGTAVPVGRNTFLGEIAGNLTLGSTAATTSEGSYNVGVGYTSLNSLTCGYQNTGLGSFAGQDITTGHFNVMVGSQAGRNITTGFHNTIVGSLAGCALLDGVNNVAVGRDALKCLVSTNNNTVIGTYAGALLTGGASNTIVGYNAYGNSTNGNYNIAIGQVAGKTNTSGTDLTDSDYGVFIGFDARPTEGGQCEIIIGGNATLGCGSNTARIGGNNQTDIYFDGQTHIGTINAGTSDSVLIETGGLLEKRDISSTAWSGSFTEGSVPFANSSGDLTEDNANLYWDDVNKRIGIGTTSPTRELEIMGDGNVYTRISSSISNDTTLELYSGCNSWSIVNEGSTSGDLKFRHQGLTKVTISSSNGYVGIGTTNPSYPLDVVGYVNSSIGYRAGNYTIFNEVGNETSFGNSAYYGVSFKTNNDVRMKIANDGNVGIGTTGPDALLELSSSTAQSLLNINKGDLYVSGSGNVGVGTSSPVHELNVAGPGDVTIRITSTSTNISDDTRIGTLQYFSSDLSSNTVVGEIVSRTPVSNFGNVFDMAFSTYAVSSGALSEKMRITGAGKVGIGTTSPASSLHIANLSSPASITLERTDTTVIGGNSIGYINFRGGESTIADVASIEVWSQETWNPDDSPTYMSFYTTPNASTTKVESMRIDMDGNVGIGTTIPSEKLTVDGSISASGDLYLDGGLYDTNNEIGLSGQLLSSTGTAVDWIDNPGVSGTGEANKVAFWTGADTLSNNSNFHWDDTNERLGIGTTSPESCLQITQISFSTQTCFTQGINFSGLLIDTTYDANHYTPGLFWRTNNNEATKPKAGIYLKNSVAGSCMLFGTSNNYSVGITNDAVLINPLGNVGIGTTSPSEKLTIEGSISSSGDLYLDGGIYDTNNEIGTSGQLLSSTGTAVDWIDATEVDGFISGSGTTNYIPIWKSSSELSNSNIYQLNGNVGIGTTSPSEKLTVNGNISGSRMVLTAGAFAGVSNKFHLSSGYNPNVSKDSIAVISVADNSTFNNISGIAALHVINNGNRGNKGNSSGSDLLRLEFNDSIHTIFNKDGNVGIGTTSPTALLELSSSTADPLMRIKGIGGENILYVSSSGNIGIGTPAPTHGLTLGDFPSSATTGRELVFYRQSNDIITGYDSTLAIYSKTNSFGTYEGAHFRARGFKFQKHDGSTEYLTINQDGNVGIGTTSPIGKLEVIPDLTVLDLSSQANGSVSISNNSNGAVATAIAGKSTLGLGIYAGTPNTNTSGDMVFHVREDDNTDFSTLSNPAFQFRRYATNLMTILRNGNVGIGITNPTHSLNVVGGIKTDQLYDKNNTSGSDGQILSSTTTGIDWIDTSEIDGFVSGSGTATYLPLWTDTNTLSSSIVFQQADGNVGVNTTTPAYELEVSGGFAATEKHFVVQDPTNPKKRLVHSSLEGPENAVYFRGISTKKVIELPEYWKWLVNSDTITVHLTPVKKYQKLYFSKYENNKVYINNSLVDKLKFNKLNYHYIIYAERKDVNKLKVYVTK